MGVLTLFSGKDWTVFVKASSCAFSLQHKRPVLTSEGCFEAGWHQDVSLHDPWALAILRCAGVARGERENFEVLQGKGEILDGELKLGSTMTHGPFSYALKPLTPNGSVIATDGFEGPAMVMQNETSKDEPYFITALTRAPARVKPFTWRSHTYTLESLHPSFHIPEPYWRDYDSVDARVEVTRPLRSLGQIATEVGIKEKGSLKGDGLSPLTAALLRLDPKQTGKLIPTETKEFPLFDDGTNGDSTANDRYWEVELPKDFTTFEGQYLLHAYFKLCRKGVCVQREASQTLTIGVQFDAQNSRIETKRLNAVNNRQITQVLIQPRDANGTPFGPGLADQILAQPKGDVKLERRRDFDGKGTYEFTFSWTEQSGVPSLRIGQFGRPQSMREVELK
jgi:hypothetical protein